MMRLLFNSVLVYFIGSSLANVTPSPPTQFFGGNIYPPSYTASGTPTIPSAPQSAYLQTLSGDSILVNFAAPESDGG